MSCPIWDLPEFDRERWDLDFLCGLMGCPECSAESGDVPWMPDAPDRAALEKGRDE